MAGTYLAPVSRSLVEDISIRISLNEPDLNVLKITQNVINSSDLWHLCDTYLQTPTTLVMVGKKSRNSRILKDTVSKNTCSLLYVFLSYAFVPEHIHVSVGQVDALSRWCSWLSWPDLLKAVPPKVIFCRGFACLINEVKANTRRSARRNKTSHPSRERAFIEADILISFPTGVRLRGCHLSLACQDGSGATRSVHVGE